MKRFAGLLIVLLLSFALPAGAAETKIGYVNLQKALNESKAGQEAKAKIGATVQEYEKTVQKRQEEVAQLQAQLEKQKSVLSPEAFAEKNRDLQQKIKDFQRFTKDIQEELQQKDADFTRRILQDLFKIVQEIGEKGNYTAIFENSENALLYADEKIDMTPEVIKAFDAQYKK